MYFFKLQRLLVVLPLQAGDTLSVSRAVMDILYHTQFPEVRGFDKTAAVRAEKRELLRRRNNVTLCRSQNRDFEGKLIKSELKEKRQLEYLKRRSVSPELCGFKLTRTKNSTKTMSVKPLSYQMYTNVTTIPANGHKKVVSAEGSSTADDPSSSARVNKKDRCTASSDVSSVLLHTT